ncbi:uncharacterized protein LOC108744780 isoform X2 [Agrilus planipennis]|uniref:Uncharacterized protein LOC108744780 isoform X2 n=1 Tax=Agrilus planipennis TaxID=224129 RepID=A0A1W4XUT7_AGRPL|nr:uncharacterized protein LOC108744780 isoform X2 [Agrilus planipennis]
MTKAIVFLLDKFVWMLLITVIATQALQFAGVVPTPKGLEEISYEKDNNYEFQLGIGDSGPRGKRQTDGAGNIIDNIFNMRFDRGDIVFRHRPYRVIRAVM